MYDCSTSKEHRVLPWTRWHRHLQFRILPLDADILQGRDAFKTRSTITGGKSELGTLRHLGGQRARLSFKVQNYFKDGSAECQTQTMQWILSTGWFWGWAWVQLHWHKSESKRRRAGVSKQKHKPEWTDWGGIGYEDRSLKYTVSELKQSVQTFLLHPCRNGPGSNGASVTVGSKENNIAGGGRVFLSLCALIERGQRVRLFLDCLSKLRSYHSACLSPPQCKNASRNRPTNITTHM